jgi:two-component system response regulator DevR
MAGCMVPPNGIAKRNDVSICLIAENRLLRDTLGRLLRKQAGICVVGVAANAENVREQIGDSGCDIVLADCAPGSVISVLLCDLHKENSQFKILLIGMDDDPEVFLKAVHLGVRGYVLKDASASEIIASVRGVARGEAACPPNLCMALIEQLWSMARCAPSLAQVAGRDRSGLTNRQAQLMSLVAKGLTNKEIAANLNLSQFTVKNHIRRVMRQVEAASRHDAVELIRATGHLLNL